METVVDILKCINDGVGKPTKIMYRANIGWNPLRKYLRFMLDQELITAKRKGQRVFYEITEKGLRSINYVERVKDEPLLAYIPQSFEGTRVIAKGMYEVDLTKTEGEEDFPCPKCGTEISPQDQTDKTYQIVETSIRNKELAEIVLKCMNCGSRIRLVGFIDLKDVSSKDKLREMYKRAVLDYVTPILRKEVR